MFDSPLFNLEDVRIIRKVSVNIDDFEMYAVEVQRNFLTKLLGDTLYNALILDSVNPTLSTRFDELVNGVIYQDGGRDVIFRGIKLYLSYLWLYAYSIDSSIQHTPIGAMIFKDERAEQAQWNKANNEARTHFMNSADGMEEGILKFLNLKIATYPEFTDSYQIQQASASNMSFKVLGKSYRPPSSIL